MADNNSQNILNSVIRRDLTEYEENVLESVGHSKNLLNKLKTEYEQKTNCDFVLESVDKVK